MPGSPASPALLALGATLALSALLVGLALGLPRAIARSHAIQSRILSRLDALPDGARLVVLGCHAETKGRPNRLFVERIATGAAAWHSLSARTNAPPSSLLASGHGPLGETDALRDGLIAAGVPASAIELDPAGLRTIHSIERIAQARRVDDRPLVIVTQAFHLPRALWLAQRLSVEAHGLPAAGRLSSPRARLRERAAWIRAFVDVPWRRRHRT